MTLYIDPSALLKVYCDEPGSRTAQVALDTAEAWATGRHTIVEVRRNLARQLDGAAHTEALEQFERDLAEMGIVELSPYTCDVAADLAIETGARTLDALHLGAMWAAGGSSLTMLTFDRRLAAAARHLGFPVVGVPVEPA